MGSALVYVLVVGAVAAVVYLATAFLAGRGEELGPMPPGATPTRLPARDLEGTDVRDLRFQQSLRGYRMSEVDWALDRLAAEVDSLRSRLAAYEDDGGPRDEGLGAAGADDPTPTDPTARLPSERAAREGNHGWPPVTSASTSTSTPPPSSSGGR